MSTEGVILQVVYCDSSLSSPSVDLLSETETFSRPFFHAFPVLVSVAMEAQSLAGRAFVFLRETWKCAALLLCECVCVCVFSFSAFKSMFTHISVCKPYHDNLV
ncbi:hypothetical protein CHARACLAT_020353 [Characodon lateralis]|uniref:Uncharacterized protein n=1 Tax=Characodon lateralis TaxID=208331 RepID=A0ABU7EVV8_9TELE|nr:hypothetical protein [Characodon lateralis]